MKSKLTERLNHLLVVLRGNRDRLPKSVLWEGMELAASINAWLLESHHEATGHLHRHRCGISRAPAGEQKRRAG